MSDKEVKGLVSVAVVVDASVEVHAFRRRRDQQLLSAGALKNTIQKGASDAATNAIS